MRSPRPCGTLRRVFRALFGSHGASERNSKREAALDILERHSLCARFYLPHLGMDDEDLAEACRWLAENGYIITTVHGALVGRTVGARPVPAAVAQRREPGLEIVRNNGSAVNRRVGGIE